MNPKISWCEDFMFNLEYIRHCENIYVFKKVKYIDVDKFIKLKNIYHTSIVNNLVCFDTNIGYMYFDFDEVIIK